MKGPIRNLLTVAGAIALSLSIAAGTARADLVDDIVQRGTLRVAVQTQGPPISFVNKEGKRTGFAVEIARRLANDMGVELKLMSYEWKGLIPALLSNKADMIAADMTPSVQRSLKISFTEPVFFEKVVAFTTAGSGITNMSDINAENVAVAATQGSTHYQIAQEKFPKAEVKEYAGGGPAVAHAVAAGRAEVGVNNSGSVRGFLREYTDLRRIEGTLRRDPLSFAVRPENTHMMQVLNNYITLLKVRGQLEDIRAYWWNSDAWRQDHM
ncbi:ABC transporter substrate-binding protein [Rhodovibrio sodomensis]|uniref:ABC transporter substrate-binding protein n=1 Tax=Rhodovibrio sodomensis TaxID=1088 RepID=UPI001904576C|nr:ABC transporter substrate-binding protein [Rhodovibrio sodomensis]